jgi:hypothetical protein
MKPKIILRRNKRERGQTIVLVAISLLSLLAIAALAVDVATLYAARSEIQRSADAVALAAAKAIADSGFTTLPSSDTHYADAKLLAQSMSNAAIDAMLSSTAQVNLVAGALPTAVPAHPTVDFSLQGNPRITVTLQVTTLPTFFARIWGNRTATVKASATAEAYNPSNVQNFTPIAPKAVKPWLVANVDPNSGTPFIDTLTGNIEAGVTGEVLNLTADCSSLATGCALLAGGNPPGLGPHSTGGYPQVEYVPALVASPPTPNPNVCPSACAVGGGNYEESIACADMTTSYLVVSCGGGTTYAQWDNTVYPGGVGGLSDLGTECLINASGTGNNKGQDELDTNSWPTNPMHITAGAGNLPQNGYLVTTSTSIATIPIIDRTTFQATSPYDVTIVGFLQAFVDEVHGSGNPNHAGDIRIHVLNVAGCSSSSTNSGATPIVGGSGTSPVPVRLIGP